jgi:anti-sigma regulatory factor (Ser/Thr protein kinase)
MDTHPNAAGPIRRDEPLLTQPAGPGIKNELSLEFEAGPDAAGCARNALLALESRVDPEILNDVRLLVSELVTNSVRHAGVRPEDIVQMNVQVTANTLRVEVSDPGEGFEPRPRDLDHTRPGGWGLYLVDQLSDRWGVARGRLTRVWFELDAKRPRGATA